MHVFIYIYLNLICDYMVARARKKNLIKLLLLTFLGLIILVNICRIYHKLI